MKKSLVYLFSHASRFEEIEECSVVPELDLDKPMQSHDSKDSFLRIVFAIDERTKLPKGDLQYLVSEKVNPEVREWILKNLLIDVSASAFRSSVKGLSDDDIANLSMQPSETIQDYMSRVNTYMHDNAESYERLANAYIQSNDGKRNVSFKSE